MQAGINPLKELEASRLKKVIEKRQTQIQEKVDKTQLVLKSNSEVPDDWSIKKSFEVQFALNTSEEVDLKDIESKL